MQLLPIQTPLLKEGDSLASFLRSSIQSGDIVAVSAKAVSAVEGNTIDLHAKKPKEEAKKWADLCGVDPAFCQAVLDECEERGGRVVGHCPGALLTQLRPSGLSSGVILCANAGLDRSNTPEGTAIGWPNDPIESVKRLRKDLGTPVVLTDSCCRPRRWGVVAMALVVSGIQPLLDQEGERDLYGRPLRITKEAVGDQLATAANMLMGNAGQSIPAIVIRDHHFSFSSYEGWVPGIEPEEDLFSLTV